jgi:hypothetical protein
LLVVSFTPKHHRYFPSRFTVPTSVVFETKRRLQQLIFTNIIAAAAAE